MSVGIGCRLDWMSVGMGCRLDWLRRCIIQYCYSFCPRASGTDVGPASCLCACYAMPGADLGVWRYQVMEGLHGLSLVLRCLWSYACPTGSPVLTYCGLVPGEGRGEA
eukprot:1450378-Rhodomonas_salina.4